LEIIGLIDSINKAAISIDLGRKGFATKGKAEEGRINYEKGIAKAMTAYKEAQATADPQTILLAEYTFITQELEFCEKTDKDVINSLSRGIRFFVDVHRRMAVYNIISYRPQPEGMLDAFLALETVQSSHYDIAEKTFPHDAKYRVKGFPMDSFHIACKGHKGRLQNILKTPRTKPHRKSPVETEA